MCKDYNIFIRIPTMSDDTDKLVVTSSDYDREEAKGYFSSRKLKFYIELGCGIRFYPVHRYWRPSVQELGADLKKTLWEEVKISKIYDHVMNKVEGEENRINLVFEGDVPTLSLPFELLCDENSSHFRPLVITHPLIRRVPVSTPKNSLKYDDKELNILLVSSQVSGEIDNHFLSEISSKDEIDQLFQYFNNIPKFHVERIDSPSYQELENRLMERKWHIFHYAGHGGSLESPDGIDYAIFLKSKDKPEKVKVPRIQYLFKNYASSLRFAYFSCCEGALQKNVISEYLYPCFLGIMDALIEAKVPSFLAFKWRLNDKIASEFALTFYKELFDNEKQLKNALFETRKYIHSVHENHNACVSSILVTKDY